MCGLAAEVDVIRAQFGLTAHMQLVLTKDTDAHIGERRAVAVVGAIGEQIASDQSKRATTILAVLFCHYTVRYFITNLLCLDF